MRSALLAVAILAGQADAALLRKPQPHKGLGLVELALAGPDAMDDVKSMIAGMITHLQSSSNADTTRAEWCSKELTKAASDVEERKEDVDTMGARLDSFEAKQAKRTLAAQELTEAQAQLASDTVASTEQRHKEAAAYSGHSAPVDMSTPAEDLENESAMEAHVKVVAAAEQAHVEAEVSEKMAEHHYEQHEKKLEEQREAHDRQSKDLEHERVTLNHDQVLAQGDARRSKEMLDGAVSYLEQVKHQCGPGHEDTAAVRTQRRNEQLENLNNAHDLLSGENVMP